MCPAVSMSTEVVLLQLWTQQVYFRDVIASIAVIQECRMYTHVPLV